MRLSTRGRYAVTAMAHMALRHNLVKDTQNQEETQHVTLSEISTEQDISLSYLEQLFGKLRRAGLVESARGPRGGYVLAKPAEAIRVSEIMAAVDETLNATNCSGKAGAGCGGSRAACLTHDLWEQLSTQVHIYLHGVSLADVVSKSLTPCNALPIFSTAMAEKTAS